MELNGRPRSLYAVLCVSPHASSAEIRSAYRKLALKWHPDRRGRVPWLVEEEAKHRFQLIQEAYEVLSDGKRRALYDAGLFDPVKDDAGEAEEPVYSMEDLQKMFNDMVQSFTPIVQPTSCSFDSSNASKRRKRHGNNAEAAQMRMAECQLYNI